MVAPAIADDVSAQHDSHQSRFVVGMTSVPRRFDSALRVTLQALLQQENCPNVILNIPYSYRKWGSCDVPKWVAELPRVTVHRPHLDYGPATKLLGTLLFLRYNPSITHILTVDDDIRFKNSKHLDYLMRCSRILPQAALTIGGIALGNSPYRRGAGLKYGSSYRYVDAPAGYLGVVYPVQPLAASESIYSLFNEFPQGIFNDDDIYFGVVLNHLGVPLAALPSPLFDRWQISDGAGESAVSEGVALDRETNESELFAHAVRAGLLVPAHQRLGLAVGFSSRVRLIMERVRTARSLFDSQRFET